MNSPRRPHARLVVRGVVARGVVARGVVAGGVAALILSGCWDAPVTWTPPSSATAPRGAVEVAITAQGDVHLDTMAQLAARITPPSGPLCAGSLRLARAGPVLHAVWWAPRADSSARLVAARSADSGRSWSTPASVDSLDQGVTGCRRAPASIAADSRSGYVHVAYALAAPEGPGLFFSHSMDGGSTFHSPVPIFYGERLGRTSVAADGDLVVVGFEDPNSSTPRVGLALSRTMGHIFESRLLPVSNDNEPAAHPVTAVQGNHVAIAWHNSAATTTSTATSALIVRAGVVH